MNIPRFFRFGRIGCILGILNALLAIGLTFASLLYVRPKDCNRLCGAPEGTPCPIGACRFGEQRAGWPVAFVVDNPGGGSPTNGWGILGPEDPPLLVPLILDVLFYSLLLWAAWCIVQATRGQRLPLKTMAISLPLTAILAAFVWLFYFFFSMNS